MDRQLVGGHHRQSCHFFAGQPVADGSHDHTKVTFDFLSAAIVLEDGVWIGAKAVVAGGVTCRSHSILGIGSVAEKDRKPIRSTKGIPPCLY